MPTPERALPGELREPAARAAAWGEAPAATGARAARTPVAQGPAVAARPARVRVERPQPAEPRAQAERPQPAELRAEVEQPQPAELRAQGARARRVRPVDRALALRGPAASTRAPEVPAPVVRAWATVGSTGACAAAAARASPCAK